MRRVVWWAGVVLAAVGCASTTDRVLDADQSTLKLRAMQTRSFETQDKKKTLRAVVATLQDLGFVLDKADDELGTVSATKLKGYELRLTVTVRPGSGEKMLVRASGQYNLRPIDEPELYQQFFTALEKAMFLQGQAVD